MLSDKLIRNVTDDYRTECCTSHHKPRYEALADRLNICSNTLRNAVQGQYKKGCPYAEIERSNRLISNDSFECLRELFKNDGNDFD